jgi:hypothetical protein
MQTKKTFVQKTNDYINQNNLNYSRELFNQILELIKNDKNNIIDEQIRILELNNNSINNNYETQLNYIYWKVLPILMVILLTT